ncbi:YfhO family protein [Nafulsella turpanensis]|uniref:YfhO family protein n=1 Tax=Nafulsella turpanensis TaxID=1265690 RepID=UPI00058B2129|nr:YfhO family protein [Nafulsella turpanensis]
MKSISFKEHILPHLIAVVVFIAVTLIFFWPLFMENKVINQNDILQGAGAGQEIIEYRAETGEEALWTNSMFGGMPAYLIDTVWGRNVLYVFQQVLTLNFPSSAGALFIGLVSFYVLLLVFRVRPYLAIIGAVAYAFSSFTVISIEAGHIWKVRAIGYMPLVLAGIHLTLNNRRLLGFALTALAVGLELNANHLQITYYLLILVLIYLMSHLIYAIKEDNLKKLTINVGILTLAAIIGLAANIARIWATYEYGQYSTRGPSELTLGEEGGADAGLEREYVFEWSSGVFESFTLLVPNLYGGASQQALDADSELAQVLRQNQVPQAQINQFIENAPTYWGDQPFTSGPIYAGAIVIFLFILGMFFLDNRYRIWLAVATLVSLILSWGDNFPVLNYFLYDYLPAYNKFRAVSMAVVIALLTLPLAGFLGLEAFLQKPFTKENKKNFWCAAGISGGLALLFLVFAGAFSFEGAVDQQLPEWLRGALKDDRESLLQGDALRSLLFIVAAGALLIVYKLNKLPYWGLVCALFALVFIDLYAVDRRYLNEENFVKESGIAYFKATPADEYILQDDEVYRVLNLQNPFNEARTSFFHHSIGGYHGAKMGRYQELITHCMNQQISQLIQNLQAGIQNFEAFGVLNMLNTRYLLAGTTPEGVFKNPAALGNAWFIERLQPVNSANEEIRATCQLNPERVAVIDRSQFQITQTNFNNSGNINLVKYTPNHLTYKVVTPEDSYAVFSEIYYPKGWNAYIDGEQVDYERVNYVLRGMMVPAGNHTVEFKFEPNVFQLGSPIMFWSSIFLLILFFGVVAYCLYKEFWTTKASQNS